ncbi:hypothetical protein E3N88_35948 [Mikania micrantha]|uniref:Uncharacterized protein n=1 Tax=Mikania micrantha TaxID=192012 RepID=A0A5N6M2Q1_9ASTR|nr:hypothetical protein E3N88_35948 [Mikania micrantha]
MVWATPSLPTLSDRVYGEISRNSTKLGWKVNEPAPPCEWITRHSSGTIAYLDSSVKVLDCFASSNMTLRLTVARWAVNSTKLAWKVNEPAPPCEWKTRHDSGTIAYLDSEGTGQLCLHQHDLKAYTAVTCAVRLLPVIHSEFSAKIPPNWHGKSTSQLRFASGSHVKAVGPLLIFGQSGEGTGLLRLLQHDLEAYSCKMSSLSIVILDHTHLKIPFSRNSTKLAWKVIEPAPPCEGITRHGSGTIAYLDSSVKVPDCFASTNMTLRLTAATCSAREKEGNKDNFTTILKGSKRLNKDLLTCKNSTKLAGKVNEPAPLCEWITCHGSGTIAYLDSRKDNEPAPPCEWITRHGSGTIAYLDSSVSYSVRQIKLRESESQVQGVVARAKHNVLVNNLQNVVPMGEKLHWAFPPLREGLANAQRVTPGSGWADQSAEHTLPLIDSLVCKDSSMIRNSQDAGIEEEEAKVTCILIFPSQCIRPVISCYQHYQMKYDLLHNEHLNIGFDALFKVAQTVVIRWDDSITYHHCVHLPPPSLLPSPSPHRTFTASVTFVLVTTPHTFTIVVTNAPPMDELQNLPTDLIKEEVSGDSSSNDHDGSEHVLGPKPESQNQKVGVGIDRPASGPNLESQNQKICIIPPIVNVLPMNTKIKSLGQILVFTGNCSRNTNKVCPFSPHIKCPIAWGQQHNKTIGYEQFRKQPRPSERVQRSDDASQDPLTNLVMEVDNSGSSMSEVVGVTKNYVLEEADKKHAGENQRIQAEKHPNGYLNKQIRDSGIDSITYGSSMSEVVGVTKNYVLEEADNKHAGENQRIQAEKGVLFKDEYPLLNRCHSLNTNPVHNLRKSEGPKRMMMLKQVQVGPTVAIDFCRGLTCEGNFSENSLRYDLLHNEHLNIGFDALFKVAQLLLSFPVKVLEIRHHLICGGVATFSERKRWLGSKSRRKYFMITSFLAFDKQMWRHPAFNMPMCRHPRDKLDPSLLYISEGTGLLRLLQHDLEAYSYKMGSVYTEGPKGFLLEMDVSYGPNLSPNSTKLAWKDNEPALPCEWITRHGSGTIAYLDSSVSYSVRQIKLRGDTALSLKVKF